MDDPRIPQLDQERIDSLVANYRHSLESLYRIAHIQGQIDGATEVVRKMKAPA